MCIAHRLLHSTSEISDATASMPSPGYFALQHRVAPPRKAYSLTSSAFIAFGALYPFSLFKPVFRGDQKVLPDWQRLFVCRKFPDHIKETSENLMWVKMCSAPPLFLAGSLFLLLFSAPALLTAPCSSCRISFLLTYPYQFRYFLLTFGKKSDIIQNEQCSFWR